MAVNECVQFSPSATRPLPKVLQHLLVLLVEDDRNDAELAVRIINDAAGFSVTVTRSLADAIKQLNLSRFDAVLLDLNLPDSVGLDTIRIINAHENAGAVVVLTGSGDDEIAMAALREGAQDFIIKHLMDKQCLPRRIRFAVERRQIAETIAAEKREFKEEIDRLKSAVCKHEPQPK